MTTLICLMIAFANGIDDTQANCKKGITELPVAIASFGAAYHDGHVYVLGGHIGRKHEHSTENLSPAFFRHKADGSGEWEKLPGDFPRQSIALVSDGRFLYRVGGMTAHNKPAEPEDLHSVVDFGRFDPGTRKWSDLPPLPTGRSSHDAVVIDGKLYVAGGWCLAGSDEKGNWSVDTYAIDLKNPTKWQTLPKMPSHRRAVAAAGKGRKLIVVGGIDDNGKLSKRADMLDLQTRKWSSLPDLPANGFGASAFFVDDTVFVSGMNGIVYALNPQMTEWRAAVELQTARIFHRMIPVERDRMLFLGGANREMGHLTNVESIALPRLLSSQRKTASALPKPEQAGMQ